jgi:hypothetical protein
MSTTTRVVITLDRTFSFYVAGKDPVAIRECTDRADSVVVGGSAGPAAVRRLRSDGWDGTAIFDRAGYSPRSGAIDSEHWFHEQAAAGADRLLTPGRWIGWSNDRLPFEDQIAPEVDLADGHDATIVIAIERRWLTNSAAFDQLQKTLKSMDSPVALVLGDRGDPLSYPEAVNSLIALTKSVKGLSILRTDHAAIGALAFDAAHGSIGLTPSRRHFVPPETSGSAIPHDHSPRVFVMDLMDWFTATKIAGWSTERVSPTCGYGCCDGARIDRFFDPRYEQAAGIHNQTVLSALAEDILNTPQDMRRRAFAGRCADAIERYGQLGGITTVVSPHSQLSQWAQYY